MQTQTQSKENLLIAAGFQVIVPKTAAQQQKLQTLQPRKVTLVRKGGQNYYVFPDAAHQPSICWRFDPVSGIPTALINWRTKILKPRS